MQRVATLLDKIRELNEKDGHSPIEIDLMMDYTRVLYADLLEWRNKTAFTESHTLPRHDAGTGAGANPPKQSVPDIPPVRQEAPLQPIPEPREPQVPDTHKPSPSQDIRKLIGINDKYQFISELFGNNRDAYEEVIGAMNSFEAEEDALAWIHEHVYQAYGWDDDNETLVIFYRVISVFFSER